MIHLLRDDTFTFAEFVLTIAKLFFPLHGFVAEDDPVPEKLSNADVLFRRAKLERVQTELDCILSMNEDSLKAENEAHYQEESNRYQFDLMQRRLWQQNVLDIAKQAQEWQPPTERHMALKSFILRECTLDFRSSLKEPKRISDTAFREKTIERLENELDYCAMKLQRAEDALREAQEWLDQLRESLPVHSGVSLLP